jgi:signal transduction histidine kinase
MLQEESGDAEILADPMLPKVFYNLIDNSVRHGQTVTEIRISILREKEGRLVIIYEDNGIGIPAPEKELIFNREFGKNTGLGLFLIREILAITGITIRENGTPGTGARFEILVPKGASRFTPA